MSADRFSTGKPADRLIDNCLKDRGRQIRFGSPLIDQRLDIGFGKYAAACGNGIQCLIMLGVFIETGCIGLQKRCHLVDKRAGTSRTDAVHTLLDIAALKIDDLCVFSAEFDRNVGLWRIVL